MVLLPDTDEKQPITASTLEQLFSELLQLNYDIVFWPPSRCGKGY